MELERQVGQALIHRLPSGYSLTDFGERMLAPARQVAQAVALLEHR
jgi:DNA-binding transcriptional LysR family regulator